MSLQELIRLGAKNLVVPGNLPIGCVPDYLMIFKSDKEEDYQPQTGCLRWMNEFSQYHNKLLVEELKKLRKLHPGVTIIYADYFGAAMEIFLSPEQYGRLRYFPLFSTMKFNLYLSEDCLTDYNSCHQAFRNYLFRKPRLTRLSRPLVTVSHHALLVF